MTRVNLRTLLERCHDLGQFQDPIVVKSLAAVHNLKTKPEAIDIAGACLGNSYEAVDKLVQSGLIPKAFSEAETEALMQDLRIRSLKPAILRENRRDIASWLGLPSASAISERDIPDRVEASYPLFPHQRAALREVQRLLAKGEYRVLVHMPTGAGKTRTTMNLVAEKLRQSEGLAVLWMASTTELCEQAAGEFVEAWRYLGDRTVPVVPAWGGRDWHPEEVGDGIIISTPQTLYSRRKRESVAYLSELGSRLSLIIFDEAHQAIAPTFKQSAEHLSVTGSGAAMTPIIGLTATPGRTFSGSDSDDELVQFFDRNKVTLDTSSKGGAENPVEYLIEEGYLADPKFELIHPRNSSLDTGTLSEDFTYEADDVNDISIDVDEYLALVYEAVRSLDSNGHRRILVFAASVELAQQISAMLRATGYLAESVHHDTPAELRAGMIQRYRSKGDRTRILVNYGVLTTGFDAPQTSAAVIARPTRSVVLYNQMVGRAIRGVKAGGNETATILTVVDPDVPAFGSIAAAFTHWEELWDE